LKDATAGPLPLFKVSVVPVPLKTNQSFPTYTRLKDAPEYTAMGTGVTVEMTGDDLDACTKQRDLYVCTERTLVRMKPGRTCVSMIFDSHPGAEIRQWCKFEVLLNYTPPVQVLETENELLVANIEQPWSFQCREDYLPPEVVANQTYFMISRSVLCHCAIRTGFQVIARHVELCHLKHARFTFYPVNQAFRLIQDQARSLPGADVRLHLPANEHAVLFKVGRISGNADLLGPSGPLICDHGCELACMGRLV